MQNIQRKKSLINTLYVKKHIKFSFTNQLEMTELYRSLKIDYPKFFKMDGLSKLGFLASELIFRDDENRFVPNEKTAMVFFNRSSSLDIDTQYQETIRDNESYFPSPSLFVYTLPNIVAGEIAIRNKFFGETFFYICKFFDATQMVRAVANSFQDQNTNAVLAAWIEHFEVKREVLMILVQNGKEGTAFTEEQLSKLYYE